MNDDKRAELLMDHYRDSFGILLGHWKSRNRLFMYALIVMALIALNGLSPGSLDSMINAYIRDNILKGPADYTPLNFAIVDLIARFVLLCLVINYFQRSILVDRSYKYIHRLESRIRILTGEPCFDREGKAYFSRSGDPNDQPQPAPPEAGAQATRPKDDRPLALRWIGCLYIYAFPVLLCVLVIWQSYTWDFDAKQVVIGIFSAVCSLAIVIYSASYMLWVARKT